LAIPEWVSSGILKDIYQIGIEIHTFGKEGEEQRKELLQLLNEMRKLHQLGFRLISSANNECVGRNEDIEKRYYNVFELVYYKLK
jgi:hypothetical protein